MWEHKFSKDYEYPFRIRKIFDANESQRIER